MKAMVLRQPAPIEQRPLILEELPIPHPGPGQIRLRVRACGVCHTDLHLVEGDLPLVRTPTVPGHQIVGEIDDVGETVPRDAIGQRVGVPWLHRVCGKCAYCESGRENLCDSAQFTGLHVDGGFAEYMVVDKGFAYPIPEGFDDIQAAPLLCAGIIGYRALRLSEIRPGQRLGLWGFGASAHVVIQIAKYWHCEIYVVTRDPKHRAHALELGAVWAGGADETPPEALDSAINFTPAGSTVPAGLRALKKGGVLALAGIHMSPIPEIDYAWLYGERAIRSVANSTRRDARELLALAAEIPIETTIERFRLEDVNEALARLKRSEIRGAAVVAVSDSTV